MHTRKSCRPVFSKSVLALALCFVAASCGNSNMGGVSSGASSSSSTGSSSSSTSSSSGTIPVGATTTVYSLTLSGSTSSSSVGNAVNISAGGVATISVTVKDSTGALAPDSTQVTFAVTTGGTLGSLSGTSAVTKSGVATVSFTSTAGAGNVTITSTVGTSTSTIDIVITPTYTVTVAVNPAVISLGGTSSISATVKDSASANAPDGTQVAWSINDTTLGTITASSTTSSGVATATFNASYTKSGSVTITAARGSFTGTASVTISPAAVGSIVYTSATPQIIGVKGSGQPETSTVIFTVLDLNGTPVPDGTKVDICMKGPSGGRLASAGGEYIGILTTVSESYTDANANGCYDSDKGNGTAESFTDAAGGTTGVYDSPNYTLVSTVGGEAKVAVHSGKVAGNITLFASVVGKSLSTAAPVISVGGGVPTMKSFSIASTKWNIAGLDYYNTTGVRPTISVYLADRFGNANILAGTTVSFFVNAGATDISSGIINSSGSTSVVWRGQNPAPPALTRGASDTLRLHDLSSRYNTSLYTPFPVASGTGCTLNTTAVSGVITSATVATGGSGYAVGDFLVISGGNGNAVAKVLTVTGTAVASVGFTFGGSGGTGYSTSAGVTTSATNMTINPHTGVATMMVSVVGEEDFADLNGNGLYDSGEPFTDTVPEPFLDSNGNGIVDGLSTLGTPTDCILNYDRACDLFMDTNWSLAWNGTANGTWDATKTLFKNINLVFSGGPHYVLLKETAVNGALSKFRLDALSHGSLAKVNYTVAGGSITTVTENSTSSAVTYVVGDIVKVPNAAGNPAILKVQDVTSTGLPISYTIISGGTGYAAAGTGVSLSEITPSVGRGATVTFTASNGVISANPTAGSTAGSGYSVGDILTISSGDLNAHVMVSSVGAGGAPTGYTLVSGGSGYSSAGANIPLFNMESNKGFTLLVGDKNLNPLSSGSTITITGTHLVIPSNLYTAPNTNATGPTEIEFGVDGYISNVASTPGAYIKVLITNEGVDHVYYFYGFSQW